MVNNFKVGDKVKCIDADITQDIKNGKEYTVESIDDQLVYLEEVDGGYFDRRFELVKPKFKFNVGDVIESDVTGYQYTLEKICEETQKITLFSNHLKSTLGTYNMNELDRMKLVTPAPVAAAIDPVVPVVPDQKQFLIDEIVRLSKIIANDKDETPYCNGKIFAFKVMLNRLYGINTSVKSEVVQTKTVIKFSNGVEYDI